MLGMLTIMLMVMPIFVVFSRNRSENVAADLHEETASDDDYGPNTETLHRVAMNSSRSRVSSCFLRNCSTADLEGRVR